MNDEKTQAVDHLAAMRMLTEWTGQVTENQVKTLNLWPSVMLHDLKRHRVTVNLLEHKVVFHLELKPGKRIKDPEALARIEAGVWALLGDTWYTMVRAGKKVVYAGTRRKEFKLEQFNSVSPSRKGPKPERAGGVSKVRRGK